MYPHKKQSSKAAKTASKPNLSNNPWQTKEQPQHNPENTAKSSKKAAAKFKEVQKENLEAAKRHIQNYESSSEEEDLEIDSLLESVFKGYGGERNQLGKTQTFLENIFQSGAATCLICIGTVKRADYIWSCENCYSFFHLNCLQRWAKDNISQQKLHQSDDIDGYYNNLGEYIQKPKTAIKWCCPKCRFDYLPTEIPQHYECFCKKEINPVNHAWLVPHSCGEICGKPLKSSRCTHRCVLLCHPGPCPPCAQIIR